MANVALSDYTEANLSNHLFRTDTWTKAPELYFALLTAAPDDTGGGTEVTGGNYARVHLTASDTNFSVTDNVATNLVPIAFPSPINAWGVAAYIAIYDADIGGNLLLWSELTAPKTIGATDPAPYFAVGAYVCTYTSTSTELAAQVLSFIFKTTPTWTKPTSLNFDFYTVAPTEIGGGTKVTGGSYVAVSVTPSDANFTQTVNGSNGTTAITNTNDLVFPAPTADWGVVPAISVSTSSGFYICYATFPSRSINNGDAAPVIEATDFVWAIN
jgi:hypothetical protein